MIVRHRTHPHTLSCALLLLSLAAVGVSAADLFDCHAAVGDYKYDLTKLAGVHTISREWDSPPTKWKESLTFNLCEAIPKSSSPEVDQCPEGTLACLTKVNVKEHESPPERVTEVLQLATDVADTVTFESLTSPSKGVALTFKGATYSDPHAAEPKPQSFHVRVLCDTEASDPTFKSYDGSVFTIEWKATAGCAMGDPSPDKDDEKTPDDKDSSGEWSAGSGLGYFFLILLIAFFVYLGLGAYYNYSTYGASGLDLIPHRDFWREVPYMLRDVVSHLCSTVRPRQSSRGGYIAV